MPGEREKWVAKAEQDERVIEILRAENGPPSLIAYHMQQAIEKRLKGALVGRGIRPRKTHDLEEIASMLGDPPPEPVLVALRSLSVLAWTTRYPDWEEPSESDIEQYAMECELILQWLEGH